MKTRLAVVATLVTLALGACVPQEDQAESADGTPAEPTPDGVTTGVNEPASVWSGPATLIEEASIGVDMGPEEYLFVEIIDLFATDDEIFVLDALAPAVRVYDLAGNHLRSFGRAGQGPGDFGYPSRFAVAGDGRVYVGDNSNRRIGVYSARGARLDEIPLPADVPCCEMATAEDGVWLPVRLPAPGGLSFGEGYQRHTVEGPVGAPLLVPNIPHEPITYVARGRPHHVPFSPALVTALGPDGRVFAGASDRYRIQIISSDGAAIVAERPWDPVPVTPSEADWWRRFVTGMWSSEPEWGDAGIPGSKPAFWALVPSASGELWVLRDGPNDMDRCGLTPEEAVAEEVFPQQCASRGPLVDVFDREGRYLGEVVGMPVLAHGSAISSRLLPFVDGDTVIAAVIDDAGVPMVKRYRLVRPSEGS